MIFNRSHTNQRTTATKIQEKELKIRKFKEQVHKKSNEDRKKKIDIVFKVYW